MHGSTTLISTLWPVRQDSYGLARAAMLAVAGSLLLTLSAKVQVPFWPVPMTLQPMAVLMIGMAFGPRLAMATVGLYLLEGVAGLPVFAGTPLKGIGIAYMAGPTGGYLFGFLVAATVVGWLASRGWDRRPLSTAAAMFIGTAIIYAFGILWLGTFIGWDKPVLELGMIPFLLGDAVKLALATALMPLAWKLLGTGKN